VQLRSPKPCDGARVITTAADRRPTYPVVKATAGYTPSVAATSVEQQRVGGTTCLGGKASAGAAIPQSAGDPGQITQGAGLCIFARLSCACTSGRVHSSDVASAGMDDRRNRPSPSRYVGECGDGPAHGRSVGPAPAASDLPNGRATSPESGLADDGCGSRGPRRR